MNGSQTGRKIKKNQPNLEAINNDLESSHSSLGLHVQSFTSEQAKRNLKCGTTEPRADVRKLSLQERPQNTPGAKHLPPNQPPAARRGMKGGSRQPRECSASEFSSPGSSELFSEAGEGWGVKGVNAGNRAKHQTSLEGTRGGLSGSVLLPGRGAAPPLVPQLCPSSAPERKKTYFLRFFYM